MNKRDEKLRPYLEAIPEIMKYQIVTKAVLAFWLYLLGRLQRLLLNSAGRVAVTSGDFIFLFTSWQGILMILITLLSLFVYVAVDLNGKVILSRDLLKGEEKTVWNRLSRALASLKLLVNPEGILICLYIALVAPLLGFGLSLSLTQGLYIPTFISSVIAATPLYLILATCAVLVFLSVGVANLFLMHGTVLDGLTINEAGKQSKQIMHENWKDFLKQNVLFLLVIAAVLAVMVLAVLVLPLFLTDVLPLPGTLKRGLTLFFVMAGGLLSVSTALLATPFYLMKMTQLYYVYKEEEHLQYRERTVRKHSYDKYGVLGLAVLVIAASVCLDLGFDRAFPLDSDVKVIAHRGGGNEGAENTVSGLDTAWKIGAYGSEIDIPRTKDGHYILNHDGNFSRVAGDSRKPVEMTLEEVRKLSVNGEPVPTYEEMLEASRGKVILFTELKGETADRQMADDAVRIIKEYGMEDEVVLISLKYELIDYIERTYPEMQTGFLTFASFGDTALLNCDYLGLEEESATADTIKAIHKQGKKVLIWTVNKRESQRHFLCSGADGVITDEVSQASEVLQEIRERSDLRRIIDKIRELIS